MAAHRYWRVLVTANYGTTPHCAELVMRTAPGGADACAGGTPIARDNAGAPYVAANAFNRNGTTDWWSSGTNTGFNAVPTWIGYYFAAPVEIVELDWTTRFAEGPTAAIVQASDDGVSWFDAWEFTAAGWAALETRTFTRGTALEASHNLTHTHWRVRPYVSENGTYFHALAEVELRATVGGADQCSGGTATASSNHGSSGGAAAAVDDNAGTQWIANSALATEWWAYQFAAPVKGAQVALRPRGDYPTAGPAYFSIQWSDDGAAWHNALTIDGITGWVAATRTWTLAPGAEQPRWIYVDGTLATGLTVLGPDAVEIDVPYPHAPAAVAVRAVVGSTIDHTEAGAYTYDEPPVSVTGASDVSDLGGTTTITGTGFEDGTVVVVNGVDRATTYVSPTQLTAVIPALAAGDYDVTVVLPDDTTVTLVDGLHVYAHFAIVSIAPDTLHVLGGVQAVVEGVGLSGVVAAELGGVPIAYSVIDDTELHVTLPQHAAGVVQLVLYELDDNSAQVAVTYEPGSLDHADPSTVQAGDAFDVHGEWLLPNSTVFIGGVQAPTLFISPTMITAVVPDIAPGVYDLVVVSATPQFSETLTIEDEMTVLAEAVPSTDGAMMTFTVT